MARQPKYRLESVMEQALPVVNQLGYRSCNMNTLITKTGFNRRAFYAEFGDKQRFFEALTQYYIERKLHPLLNNFDSTYSAKIQLSKFFDQYRKLINPHGCLLVTMINELSGESVQIRNLARHFYDQLSLEFIAMLERTVDSSRINIEKEALTLTFFTQAFAVNQHLNQGDDDVNTLLLHLFESVPDCP